MEKDIKIEFEKLNKRFDGSDKQFAGIDKQFAGIDKQFAGIDKQFAGIDKQFVELRKAIKPLATKKDVRDAVEELARISSTGFDDVLKRVDVRERVTKIEIKILKIEKALHLETEL